MRKRILLYLFPWVVSYIRMMACSDPAANTILVHYGIPLDEPNEYEQ